MSDVLTFIFLPNVFSENFDVLQDWPSKQLGARRTEHVALLQDWHLHDNEQDRLKMKGVPCSRAILTENREFVAELPMFFLH